MEPHQLVHTRFIGTLQLKRTKREGVKICPQVNGGNALSPLSIQKKESERSGKHPKGSRWHFIVGVTHWGDRLHRIIDTEKRCRPSPWSQQEGALCIPSVDNVRLKEEFGFLCKLNVAVGGGSLFLPGNFHLGKRGQVIHPWLVAVAAVKRWGVQLLRQPISFRLRWDATSTVTVTGETVGRETQRASVRIAAAQHLIGCWLLWVGGVYQELV